VMTWGPDHLNSSTGVFNNQIASQNAAIVLDLGEEDLVSTLGIVQQTYGGAGARQMLEDVLLEFSNDDFATTLATRSLTLADGVVYQQVDFDAVLARYVRFHPLSQYPTGSDLNIGVVELQLFNVPEPSGLVLATFGLLALGLAGWRRRQRGCPRS